MEEDYGTASVQYCIMENTVRTMISLNFSAAAKVKRRAAVRLRSCMTDWLSFNILQYCVSVKFYGNSSSIRLQSKVQGGGERSAERCENRNSRNKMEERMTSRKEQNHDTVPRSGSITYSSCNNPNWKLLLDYSVLNSCSWITVMLVITVRGLGW